MFTAGLFDQPGNFTAGQCSAARQRGRDKFNRVPVIRHRKPIDRQRPDEPKPVQGAPTGCSALRIGFGVFKVRPGPVAVEPSLEARLGHITTAVVWPAVNEGRWQTGITVGRDMNLFVPTAAEQVTPEPEPRPWIHELRREDDVTVLVQAYYPAGVQRYWRFSAWDAPEGMVRWFIDKGDGFEADGDALDYTRLAEALNRKERPE